MKYNAGDVVYNAYSNRIILICYVFDLAYWCVASEGRWFFDSSLIDRVCEKVGEMWATNFGLL
jgi:hypothetical protein